MGRGRRIIAWVLRGALLASLALVCADREGRRAVERGLREVPRDPATGVMRGAEAVHIERGRPRACLLLHGWLGTPADFAELPAALDRAGWDVHAPRHPGHGTRPSALEGLRAEELIGAARTHYDDLRARYDEVALVGFSMGGTVAMILASERPPARLVLIAPFVEVRRKWYYVLPPRRWAAIIGPLVRYLPRDRALVRVNRPAARARILTYEALATDALGALFALRRRALDRVQPGELATPTLLICSTGDQVCSPASLERLWKDLQGEGAGPPPWPRRRVLFERSDHHVLHDYDRQEAAPAIVSFLEDPSE